MALCGASFILTMCLLLLYPYGVNYGEAPLLDQSLKLASGNGIYKNSLDTPPYVIANYTPLYPFLIAIIYSLTHLPLFLVGRTLSILAALASSLLLGAMARRLIHSNISGILAAGLFLGHPYVGLWSGLVRVDLLALAFSLAGLWIVFIHWNSNSWLAVGILCLLLAVFTRQTYLLAAPLASVTWLIYNNRKRGVAFLFIYVVSVLAVFLVLNIVTRGGFYQNIVTANINRYSLGRIVNMGILFILSAPMLVIITISALLKKRNAEAEPFLTWGLLPFTVGAFITALTVGKIGSDINYFLEFISASAIWVTWACYRKPDRLVSILMVANTFWIIGFNGLLFQQPLVKSQGHITEINTLAQQVKDAAVGGPVLADERLDLVVLSGQSIYYQPFEYMQLYNAGLWDHRAFVEDITHHKFPLILIRIDNRQERWPIPVFAAIERNYTCSLQYDELVCHP